jgi:hypothetical protein
MVAVARPPPAWPIDDLLPSRAIRVTAALAISPRMTEPSAIATGPSGNLSPSAIIRISTIAFASFVPAAARPRHQRIVSPAGAPRQADPCSDTGRPLAKRWSRRVRDPAPRLPEG